MIDLTPVKHLYIRNAHDAVFLSQIFMFFCIDLDKFPFTLLFLCHLFDDRAQNPARAAPGCPEINDYRYRKASFYYILLKIHIAFIYLTKSNLSCSKFRAIVVLSANGSIFPAWR